MENQAREEGKGSRLGGFERLWAALVRRYARERRAATAAMFAIMLPVLVGAVGMAVDLSRAYLVKARLSHALDAAALAASASATSYADILSRLQRFFDANYPPEKIGVTYNLNLEIVGDEIRVGADADYNTTFLRVLGIDFITVDAKTIVQRQIKGIEVSMVLDVTGSMADNNNISALRTATREFVNIMFARNPDTGVPSPTRTPFVKVGIVPFATSVNVGPYGLGNNPAARTFTGPYGSRTVFDGSAYGAAFVSNPNNISYTSVFSTSRTRDLGWRGCILEDAYPRDTEDHGGPWRMYRWCRNAADATITTGECGDDRDRNGRWRNPNNSCPKAFIQPLTNDVDKLDWTISQLEANGNTLGNVGLVWGYRVISPEFPFTEGSEWDDEEWRKAVIVMTDGANVQNGTYSAYGVNPDTVTTSVMNSRMEEICTSLKDEGVIVYSIIFTSNIPQATKDMFERCATDEDKYHYAPEQEDLIRVFEAIARELSNLHIKG